MSKEEPMVSPKLVEIMKDHSYDWIIKLESRTPGIFLCATSFKGTYEEAHREGDRLAAKIPRQVKRILLERKRDIGGPRDRPPHFSR